jgi:hypothetical protein
MTSNDTYETILDTRKVNEEVICCLFIGNTNNNILPRFEGRKIKKIVDWLYMKKINKINKINGILIRASQRK